MYACLTDDKVVCVLWLTLKHLNVNIRDVFDYLVVTHVEKYSNNCCVAVRVADAGSILE